MFRTFLILSSSEYESIARRASEQYVQKCPALKNYHYIELEIPLHLGYRQFQAHMNPL